MTAGTGWSLGILAGGRSRRMGRDKALLPAPAGNLLDFVARRLAPEGVPVLVGVRSRKSFPESSLALVPDILPGAGPLASMAALLAACRTEQLLAVPCDTPLLPLELPEVMLADRGEKQGVIFKQGGRLEPFPVLLPVSTAPLLTRLIEEGKRRALDWVACMEARVLDWEISFPDHPWAEAGLNVNDPAAYQAFLRKVGMARR